MPTRFRPCIDLHAGIVKQIVGGTLDDRSPTDLRTNFTAEHPAEWYASLYRRHDLRGGHVIMLGGGDAQERAARQALAAWPGMSANIECEHHNGLQIGGGIHADNARQWLEAGASKVIVTSWLFPEARFSMERLLAMEEAVGRERLVVDISCRRDKVRTHGNAENTWTVAMNKWQTLTDTQVNAQTIAMLAQHCSELLVHAADVEGLAQGIDQQLVAALAEWCIVDGVSSRDNNNGISSISTPRSIPCTYAGGARNLSDLKLVHALSAGRVDLTIGSALDIFGGRGVTLDECVAWNNEQ